jgi:soluble lytic murein transglycosylase-like protein
MRADATKAENLLWQALRNRRLEGLKFRRQVPVGGFIADFICFEARLIVAEANALGATALLHPGDVLILPNPDRPVPRSARSAVDEAPEVARLLEDTARAFGWRPATVKAVAWAESRWDHGRISPRGAIGVMQVRPGTARVMSRHLGRELDPYDLEDNVVLGVAYLDWLHDRYDGDSRRILTAYVQGPTRLDESGPTPEADRYVARVLRWRELFAAGP